MPEFDAVVVGAGPNGLTAAARLATAGRRVMVIEAADTIGGGTRTAELTLPGLHHDMCASVHALGVVSPAFDALQLTDHGLAWVHPTFALAHPLGGERAALLSHDVARTAALLAVDGARWSRTFGWIDRHFSDIRDAALAPLIAAPRHPLQLARFGFMALQPATTFASRYGEDAAALFGGIAAHSATPLTRPLTSAIALLLAGSARGGWPVARGGSQSIAEALAAVIGRHGGVIECGRRARSIDQLPASTVTLFDVSPRQLVELAGGRLPRRYRNALLRYRHGPGVVKVDYALDAPVPWTAPACHDAGAVHLGGTLLEIAAAEETVARGAVPDAPFVVCGQPSFDASRATGGRHTFWAYCHVPQGVDLRGHDNEIVERIERQVERFAPGFREHVLARHVMGPAAFEAHNPNLHGGDFAGGAAAGKQLLFRPTIARDPYRTPARGIYLCSASTPPGGGVHGMCGWNAAGSALRHELRG